MIGNFLMVILSLVNEIPPKHKSYEVAQRTKAYVLSFGYLRHKASVVRLQAYLEADGDYQRAVGLLAAKGIDTTVDALRTSVWYANKSLVKALGKGFLLLLQKDPYLASLRLDFAETRLDDVLLHDAVGVIPEFRYLHYDIEDCKAELLFLARFSRSSMAFFRGKMDNSKLAYLGHLLTHPSDEELPEALRVIEWLNGTSKALPNELERL